MWGATAASYCPSRAGELPKQNMTKPHERWDGKLCTYIVPGGAPRPAVKVSVGGAVGVGAPLVDEGQRAGDPVHGQAL